MQDTPSVSVVRSVRPSRSSAGNCERCSKPFVMYASSPRRFCSNSCYRASREGTVALTCVHCGVAFSDFKSNVKEKTKTYCSAKCRKAEQEKQSVIRKCLECEQEFKTPQSRLRDRPVLYCSLKCRCIAKSSKGPAIVATCIGCGESFRMTQGEANEGRKFCSRSCAKTGASNPAWVDGKSAEEYPIEWNRKLRASIRNRDEHTCAVCCDRGNVVHHVDYNKMNCNPQNLLTLCGSCHGKTNFNRDEWEICFQGLMAFISSTKGGN